MGRLYNSYAEALAAKTECQFQIPWAFQLPSISFPPSIPLPDFSFTLPTLPSAFYCPLDDAADG